MINDFDFVVFLSVDWFRSGHKNRQHFLIAELARLTREHSKILCVERPVSPLISPLMRWGKFSKWLRGGRLDKVGANLYVYTPFVFVHDVLAAKLSPLANANKKAVAFTLRRILRNLGFRLNNLLVWIYHPYLLAYIGLVNERLLVYDCYDAYSESPRMSLFGRRVDIEQREVQILKRADIVLTVSEKLKRSKSKINPNCFLLPNAVEADHFGLAAKEETKIEKDIADISRPIIGFLGNIDCKRIDFDLINHLADTMPQYSFVFIGDIIDDRAYKNSESIRVARRKNNVHFLGCRDYSVLPYYLKAYDVCIIPFLNNVFNKNCSPLKLYEYLATGKPIVSTNIPAVRSFNGLVHIARDKEEFGRYVKSALGERNKGLSYQRQVAAQENSWEKRVEKILEIIEAIQEKEHY